MLLSYNHSIPARNNVITKYISIQAYSIAYGMGGTAILCESGLLDISWRAASSGEASDVCLRARSAFACRACASEQFNNLAVFNCFQCNLCV